MPDVAFDDIGFRAVTAKHSGLTAVDIGKPVKWTDAETVSLAVDGDFFSGMLVQVEEGLCTVADAGYVTMSYTTGSAPSYGFSAIVASTDGKVKAGVSTDPRYSVVSRNDTDKTVTFLL
jgi:hypothetical protein